MLKKTLVLVMVLSLVFSCAACVPQSPQMPAPQPTIKEGQGLIQEFVSSGGSVEEGEPMKEYPPAVVVVSQSPSTSLAGSQRNSGSQQAPPAQEGEPSISQAVQTSPGSSSQSVPDKTQGKQPDDNKGGAGGSATTPSAPTSQEELRGVWISYLELNSMLMDKTAQQYRNNIRIALENAADLGLNTIFLQVRPFGDAIYPSAYFPQSYLFDGTEGGLNRAPFDALAIAIEEAHRLGLRLEAWINPYRIRSAYATRPMHPENPANQYLAQGEDVVIRQGNIISYNPGSSKAQEHIVKGIAELVSNYQLDGIHFDDYFYPTTDEGFDRDTYAASGSSLSLAAWRRANVTALIGKVYQVTKEAGVSFGISPQGNNNNNLNAQYVDVKEIAQRGYVDYICPQMYFGYKNTTSPYQSTTEAFNRMVVGTDVKLYVGLAVYKFGKEDTWAGGGKNEWIGTTDLIAQQVQTARRLSQYAGFILYRYDCIFNAEAFYTGAACAQVKTEMDNLQAILD